MRADRGVSRWGWLGFLEEGTRSRFVEADGWRDRAKRGERNHLGVIDLGRECVAFSSCGVENPELALPRV